VGRVQEQNPGRETQVIELDEAVEAALDTSARVEIKKCAGCTGGCKGCSLSKLAEDAALKPEVFERVLEASLAEGEPDFDFVIADSVADLEAKLDKEKEKFRDASDSRLDNDPVSDSLKTDEITQEASLQAPLAPAEIPAEMTRSSSIETSTKNPVSPQEERAPDNPLAANQERTIPSETLVEAEVRERLPKNTPAEREARETQKEERRSVAEIKPTVPARELNVQEPRVKEPPLMREVRSVEPPRNEAESAQAPRKEPLAPPALREEQARNPTDVSKAENRPIEKSESVSPQKASPQTVLAQTVLAQTVLAQTVAAEPRRAPEQPAVRVIESLPTESTRKEVARAETARREASTRVTLPAADGEREVQNLARELRRTPVARAASQPPGLRKKASNAADIRLSRSAERAASERTSTRSSIINARHAQRPLAHARGLRSLGATSTDQKVQSARTRMREPARLQTHEARTVPSRQMGGERLQRMALARAVPRAEAGTVLRERNAQLNNTRPAGAEALTSRRAGPLEARKFRPVMVKADGAPGIETLKERRVTRPEKPGLERKKLALSPETLIRSDRKARIQERRMQLRATHRREGQLREGAARGREREKRTQTNRSALQAQASQQLRLKLLSALTRQVMMELNRLTDVVLKANIAKEMLEAFHEDQELSHASRVSEVARLLKMLRSRRRAAYDPRIVRLMTRAAQLQGVSGSAIESPRAARGQGPAQGAGSSPRSGTSASTRASAPTTGRTGPSTSLDIYQHKVDDDSSSEDKYPAN
jgi:hypothetical protein